MVSITPDTVEKEGKERKDEKKQDAKRLTFHIMILSTEEEFLIC